MREQIPELKPMSVEDYLNTVSYKEDPTYVPTDFALRFVNFIKLVNGGQGEENLTPVLHFKMLDTLVNDERDAANMVHRGAAKTTVFGEYMFLYLALYKDFPQLGQINLALYVSDSIDNGVKNMRKNLEFRWENSDFLQRYVPHVKFTDIRWEFKNIEGKRFIVKGYGAKTGVRGAKEMGKRPELAVLDDLVSDEDARSPTVIASIEDTIYKAVNYALHPKKRKILWSGTPFNSRDPLYKAIESGAWAVNVFPVCEEFPCSKEDFRGSWPDRFPYEYVNSQYQKALKGGKADTFFQELMLRIMNDDDRLIGDSDIKWYNRKALLERKGAFNFYITTDFATSEKTAADYSVISVWAVNSNQDWFWVDGICRRQTMEKNVDELFKLVQKYKPQSVGVEVSGQQAGFIPWLQREMLNKNIWFNLASENNSNQPGIRPATDKMKRFNVVVPWFKAGKMYFPEELRYGPEMAECMEELRLATPGGFKSKKDDFIDTISMLGLLLVWLPSEESPMKQNSNDIWEPDEEDNTSNRLSSYTV